VDSRRGIVNVVPEWEGVSVGSRIRQGTAQTWSEHVYGTYALLPPQNSSLLPGHGVLHVESLPGAPPAKVDPHRQVLFDTSQ
jgi:hypothetical protein